jgi:hypothetical protein
MPLFLRASAATVSPHLVLRRRTPRVYFVRHHHPPYSDARSVARRRMGVGAFHLSIAITTPTTAMGHNSTHHHTNNGPSVSFASSSARRFSSSASTHTATNDPQQQQQQQPSSFYTPDQKQVMDECNELHSSIMELNERVRLYVYIVLYRSVS